MNSRRTFIKSSLALVSWAAAVTLLPLKKIFAQNDISNMDFILWLRILKYARRSPSPHNVQPWKIKVLSAHYAELYYDPKRLLPNTDPDGRFLVMGFAIFMEYLSVAAQHHGFTVKAEYTRESLKFKATELQLCASIKLIEFTGKPAFDRELIFQRRTSRLKFNEKPVDEKTMLALKKQVEDFGHQFGYSQDEKLVESIKELNKDTLFYDLSNESVREELKHWLRYSDEEEQSHRDGLSAKCMRFPGWLMKSFFENHKKYASGLRKAMVERSYIKKMDGTRTVAWFSGPFDTYDNWITCGKLLARLWLIMTQNDVYMHPFGSVVTNVKAHKQLLKIIKFDEDENKIWLLARLGYSKRPPKSYRLDIRDIIV